MPFREIPGFSQNNQGGAKCSFCGQHARRWPAEDRRARTYSTGTYIHMEGPFEICEWCIQEAGKLIGMEPSAVVKLLKEGMADQAEEIEALEAELEGKTSAITLLTRELAEAEDRGAAKAAAAYDRGYRDGETGQAVVKELLEEPDFAGAPDA